LDAGQSGLSVHQRNIAFTVSSVPVAKTMEGHVLIFEGTLLELEIKATYGQSDIVEMGVSHSRSVSVPSFTEYVKVYAPLNGQYVGLTAGSPRKPFVL